MSENKGEIVAKKENVEKEFDTTNIKIICKDKTLILQKGMLPKLDYIDAKFSFQKSQNVKKLSLNFQKYSSSIINNILLYEFINKFISTINNSSEFYDTYVLLHEMNYTKLRDVIVPDYMRNYKTLNIECKNEINKFINEKLDDVDYELRCLSRFTEDHQIPFIITIFGNSNYYILRYNNIEEYLINKEDRKAEEKKFIIFKSVDEIHKTLNKEYFQKLEDSIQVLILFCEKYDFYKDPKSFPMQNLQWMLRLCNYHKKNIINVALNAGDFSSMN